MTSYLKNFVLKNKKNYKKLLDYLLQNNMVLFMTVQGLSTHIDEPILSKCYTIVILRLIMMVIDFLTASSVLILLLVMIL